MGGKEAVGGGGVVSLPNGKRKEVEDSEAHGGWRNRSGATPPWFPLSHPREVESRLFTAPLAQFNRFRLNSIVRQLNEFRLLRVYGSATKRPPDRCVIPLFPFIIHLD